jgi:hypothetical protein
MKIFLILLIFVNVYISEEKVKLKVLIVQGDR